MMEDGFEEEEEEEEEDDGVDDDDDPGIVTASKGNAAGLGSAQPKSKPLPVRPPAASSKL